MTMKVRQAGQPRKPPVPLNHAVADVGAAYVLAALIEKLHKQKVLDDVDVIDVLAHMYGPV